MTSVEAVVKIYRNLSGQQLHELWNQIYKQGVKGDSLRDILLFYLHHSMFPPPPQKFYDTLLLAFGAKGTSKKMKNVIFHILEEVCSSLESNIAETLRFSADKPSSIELLSLVLIAGSIPLLHKTTLKKLFDMLPNEGLSIEEGGKLLVFINHVTMGYPSLMPSDSVKFLGELMAGWLCSNRVQTPSSQFFGRSDKGGTEIDGSNLTVGDIFTVLTLVNNYSKPHVMGVHSFSMLKNWLNLIEPAVADTSTMPKASLVLVSREYCSLAVRQCLRSAQNDHDRALQKAVLCEVIDVLYRLAELDVSQHLQSLLIVKRIQRTLVESFRSDPKDISIFIRLLRFLLKFGEASDDQMPFCKLFLTDIVHRSYSSDLAAFDITNFLANDGFRNHPTVLQRYFPNLLKLVAFHPTVLAEEFIILVPSFVCKGNAVELFLSLLDLPLLSACLCLHQVAAMLQLNRSKPSAVWQTLLETVSASSQRPSYNHMLRNKTTKRDQLLLDETDKQEQLPARVFVKAMRELSKQELVVTCSQIVPALLDEFFANVAALGDDETNADILRVILKQIRLIYDVPGYVSVIQKELTEHLKRTFDRHPQLIFTVQDDVMSYISVLANNEICSALYAHVVWAIGAYAPLGKPGVEALTKYYEALECVIYEMLAQITSEENVSLNLLNITSSTLAKLASKCQDLIPRLLLCFSKVQRQVSSKLKNVGDDEKQAVHDRIEELIEFLKNPSNPSPSLVPSALHEEDPAMTAFLQILAQLTGH